LTRYEVKLSYRPRKDKERYEVKLSYRPRKDKERYEVLVVMLLKTEVVWY
jgi:hypothetical protein